MIMMILFMFIVQVGVGNTPWTWINIIRNIIRRM